MHNFEISIFRLYNHFKSQIQKELDFYGRDLVESIKNEIISESQRLSNECLDDTKKQNDESWIQTVKLRQSKMRNQTCYMLTQQEVMISHLQIEQETVTLLSVI